MQGTILNQILNTSLGPSIQAIHKPANETSLAGSGEYISGSQSVNPTQLGYAPKPSNYVAPKPVHGTALAGDGSYTPKPTPIHGTSLGSTGYTSSSLNPMPTVYGAGASPTYAETSFKAASSYRPPLTRQPAPSLGFAGGGTVPGGMGPSPVPPVPVIGYFDYQNGITYFDIDIFGTEYYVTQ